MMSIKRNQNLLTYDRDKTVAKLLELCKDLDRVPTNKEVVDSKIVKCPKTINDICIELGYKNRHEYCRAYGYGAKGDVLIDNVYKDPSNMTLEDYRVLWNDFKREHGKYPSTQDCNVRYKMNYNLPNNSSVNTFMRDNDMDINELRKAIGCEIKEIPKTNQYDKYIEIYKRESDKKGSPLTYHDLVNNTVDLPNGRWLVDNYPYAKIHSFNQFVELCGYIPDCRASKSLVTKTIYMMQERSYRPLIIDDFSSPKKDEIGLSPIVNIWGTFNNMKEDLGLEKSKETTKKNYSIDLVKKDLECICFSVQKEYKRKHLSLLDIREFGSIPYQSQQRHLLRYGLSVREYIESLGFELQLSGRGVLKNYDDGEVALSQYETQFTDYLRNELQLEYNIDYLRDVRYNEFIDSYSGYMNCDYVIEVCNKLIYVEIAGVLRDYKSWYYDNRALKSASREKYRLSLKRKELMLKSNNLRYTILFPEDLTVDNLNKIFT